MAMNVHIRESTAEDQEGILDIYPDAFPEEDLIPLVKELLADTASTLSLVAELESQIVANVVFTEASVEGFDDKLSLLGPLCVSTKHHRRGIGTAIVKSGLARLLANDVSSVLVLGNPKYYGRFGFQAPSAILAPYDLPEIWHGSWQVLHLNEAASQVEGQLLVTPPWQHEHLWLP